MPLTVAHGRSTLLNGEKAAIGGGETTIGGCVKHRHQQHERRHQLGYTASATKVRQMLAPVSLSKARFPQLVM
jgi:hypothetical protein